LVGPHGSGKSKLAETILGVGGGDEPSELQRSAQYASATGKDALGSLPLNIVDAPGHAGFLPEALASMVMADSTLVVVRVHQLTLRSTVFVRLLRQAAGHRHAVMLVFNGLDLVLEQVHHGTRTPLEFWETASAIVDQANTVLHANADDVVSPEIRPAQGDLLFSSALDQWAFSLPDLARVLAPRFSMTPEAWLGAAWPMGAESRFVELALTPLLELRQACDRPKDELRQFVLGLTGGAPPGVEIEAILSADLESSAKMFGSLLAAWFPIASCFVDRLRQLPCPADAQQLRGDILYPGPVDDSAALAIQRCDPDGPAMFYVARLMPVHRSQAARMWAFGRVFSGTVNAGLEVRSIPEIGRAPPGLAPKAIGGVGVLDAFGKIRSVNSKLPVGTWAAILGVEAIVSTPGTLTTCASQDTMPITPPLRRGPSATVSVRVRPETPGELPRLIEALKKLTRSDPQARTVAEDTGGHSVVAGSHVHVKACVEEVRSYLETPLQCDPVVVSYSETCTTESPCLAVRTPNNHNEFQFKTKPLHAGFAADLENQILDPVSCTSMKILADRYDWDPADGSAALWAFGPARTQANTLVCNDRHQYLWEIKDHGVAAFQWAVTQGPLAEQEIRGCRFTLQNTHLFADAIHRGAGQTVSTFRKGLWATFLAAEPRMLEPMVLASVKVPSADLASVLEALAAADGRVEWQQTDGETEVLEALLPMVEVDALLEAVSFPEAEILFREWKVVEGSPWDTESVAGQLCTELRRSRQIDTIVPTWESLGVTMV